MAFSRYNRTPVLRMGIQYGTSDAIRTIRAAIANGTLATKELVVNENQRLDTLAGSIYGEGRYFWVLAASSGVGWSLQVPPGTIILAPSLDDVAKLVS